MSEVRFDCQGLGLVARNEASILVFDTKPVLYRPVLDQIQFCSFVRGCKTCLDTKPVLDQGRFCSLCELILLSPTTSHTFEFDLQHYNNVIMSAMASQITSFTTVYSTVYLGTDQRKHQSSASLAFVWGIHRWPVNSPHKGPVTRKMFPSDDVMMKTFHHMHEVQALCGGFQPRLVSLKWRPQRLTKESVVIFTSMRGCITRLG